MLRVLVRKEILNSLLTMRFTLAYFMVTVLLVGSAGVMLGQYTTQKRAHEVARDVYARRVQEMNTENWADWADRYFDRQPLLTQFLALGAEKDADRRAEIGTEREIRFHGDVRRSPLGNLFPSVDMVFIVGVVLSLVVFMLAHDSISGERESGTLKVLLASPLSRDTVIFGKYVGGFVSLILPYATSCLVICLVLLLYPDVSVSVEEWLRIAAVFVVCLVFLAAVFSLSLFVSALVRQSAVSALVLAAFWVVAVIGIPGVSTPLAYAMSTPFNVHMAELKAYRLATIGWGMRGPWVDETARRMGRETRRNYGDFLTPLMHQARLNIVDSTGIIEREVARREQLVDDLAVAIRRVSPYGALQNATVALAGTGLQHELALRKAATEYADEFIMASSGGGFMLSATIAPPIVRGNLGDDLARALPDIAVLLLVTVLCFLGAYSTFIRREVI
jgi:hypothetical protein